MGKRNKKRRSSKRKGGGRKSLRKLKIRGGSKRDRKRAKKRAKRKGLSRKQVRKLQKGVAKRRGGTRRSRPSGRTDRGIQRTTFSSARYGGDGFKPGMTKKDKKRAKLWKKAGRELGIKVSNEDDAVRLQNLVAGGALGSGSRRGDSRRGRGGSSGRADRSSGEFKDIKAALNEDRQAGMDAAQDLANRNPSTGNNDAVERLETLLQGGLVGSPQDPSLAFEDLMMRQQADFDQRTMAMANNYETQMAGLQDQFASANQFMEQQLTAANAAKEAAERRAYNMRSAFVPQANPTAMSAAYGDLRTATRKKQNNQLSDLRVLSGIGSTGNALAGLQLA